MSRKRSNPIPKSTPFDFPPHGAEGNEEDEERFDKKQRETCAGQDTELEIAVGDICIPFIKKAIAYLENPFPYLEDHLHTENCRIKERILNYLQRETRLIQNKAILKVYYPWYLGIFSNCRYIDESLDTDHRLGSVEDDKGRERLIAIFNSYIKSVKILVYAKDNPLETRFSDTINFAGIRIPHVVSELFKENFQALRALLFQRVVPGGVVGNFGDVLDYYDLASEAVINPHEYEMLKTGQDENEGQFGGSNRWSSVLRNWRGRGKGRRKSRRRRSSITARKKKSQVRRRPRGGG
jgi:hypothetical protein